MINEREIYDEINLMFPRLQNLFSPILSKLRVKLVNIPTTLNKRVLPKRQVNQ
jgi:hypothetical protein